MGLVNRNTFSWSHLKNRFRLMRGFRDNRTVLKGSPSILYVESTNACNLSCVMCPTTIMTRPKEIMDYELFEHVIKQINPKTTELVVLHSDGEPLINKSLFDMIRFAKERGLKLMTSTNATLLDDAKGDSLIDSGLDILTISIDGITKDVYESIRVKSNFEEVMENVDRFLKKKGNRPPFVIMQMIQMKENEHQVEEFMKLWGGRQKNNVYPVIKGMTDWFNEHPEIIDTYKSCDRPWYGLVVHSDGRVSPCVHDYDGRSILGDVRQSNIYDLWNGEKMVRLREGILISRRMNDLCKDCNATPPTKHSWFVDMGLAVFDMATIAKLLPLIGYNRPKQYT